VFVKAWNEAGAVQDKRRIRDRSGGIGRSNPARLAELKRLIHEGKYESDEKLDAALLRMLPDLRGVAASPGGGSGDERT